MTLGQVHMIFIFNLVDCKHLRTCNGVNDGQLVMAILTRYPN
jgi:hypothetical protein